MGLSGLSPACLSPGRACGFLDTIGNYLFILEIWNIFRSRIFSFSLFFFLLTYSLVINLFFLAIPHWHVRS